MGDSNRFFDTSKRLQIKMPASDFNMPASDFNMPASDFNMPASDFCLDFCWSIFGSKLVEQ